MFNSIINGFKSMIAALSKLSVMKMGAVAFNSIVSVGLTAVSIVTSNPMVTVLFLTVAALVIVVTVITVITEDAPVAQAKIIL